MKRISLLLMMIWCGLGILNAQCYRFGDIYTAPDGSKGVVFYLFPDGTGGWAVALNDASASCAWGSAVDIPGLDNQNVSQYQMLLNDTSGYTSTQLIRNYQNNSAYAAGVVDFEHGWYLPSPAQLRMLKSVRHRLADVLTSANGTAMAYDWYWCSAERNDTEAWRVDLGNQVYYGRFNSASKTSLCRVRAVCTFTCGPSYVWSTGDQTASITVVPEESTVYSVTAFSAQGCSDVEDIGVTVLHQDALSIEEIVCEPYVWNGDTLAQTGEYTRTFTNDAGCDSVVTLHLTVNHATDSTVYATVVENNLPYMIEGVTYNATGSYTQILTNAAGCDSVITLHLTVNYNVSAQLDSTICESALPFTWNGVSFMQAGTQTATFTMANGADSVVTMVLHVITTPTATLNVSVVQNALPYTLNGISYSAAGTYYQNFTSASGCDSILTIYLTVYNNVTVNLDSAVCANALPFTWNDSVFTAPGTKITVKTASTGADSTVVMTLTVNPQPQASISGPTAICPESQATLAAASASSYLWNTGATTQSITVEQAGLYHLTVTNAFGCQASTYHNLSEITNPILSATIPEMCAGGTYYLTVGHQSNTDNILLGHGETTLSLADTIFLPDGIYCEPFGCSYHSPLTFTAYADGDTIQNAEDIYYVRVNIEHTFIGDLYINITCPNGQKADLLKYGGSGMSSCNSQIPASSRGWASGDNMSVGTYFGNAHSGSPSSCDPSFPGNEPGVGWNYCWSNNTTQGYSYAYGEGSYVYRVGNEHNGKVDSSNVTAGTQFYHPDDSFDNLVGCPLNGDWYIEVQDGWNVDNGYIFGWELALSTEMFGDREFNLDHATSDGPWIENDTDSMFVVTPPADLPHDTVIAYTFTVYDIDGCSFDTTVNLIFYALPVTEVDTEVCQSLLWNDSLYTESGEFEWHYPGEHCDSTFVLRVTVHPLFEETLEDEVCEGRGYNKHGLTVPPAETVGVDSLTRVFNFLTANGCDSVVTLHLAVVDTALRIISLTPDYCENMSAELMVETPIPDYVWSTGETTPSITVTMPGYYSVTATQGGCSVTKRYLVQGCHYELYLPNAISPSNGDGLNDYFFLPEFNTADMALFEIAIFNRWGEMVFYSTDKHFKWNGEYRGSIQCPAVYTYIIKYTDKSGSPHQFTGSISVL